MNEEFPELLNFALTLDPQDPMASARELLSRHFTDEEKLRTLLYYRGSYFRFNGVCYVETETSEIKSVIWKFLEAAKKEKKNGKSGETVAFKPNKGHVENVESALQALCVFEGRLNVPSWLDERYEFPPADEFMVCANGLLHLPTGVLHGSTPQFFSLSASEIEYDEAAPSPINFYRFLQEIFEEDIEAKHALQEIFGYCLSSDTRQHKIFIFIGPKRAGKGTLARLARLLLGIGSVAAPTLSSLGSNFGLEPLIGKQLAIIGDARLDGRSDIAVLVENLLSISGEDTKTVDRKHKLAWTGKLPTRFLILSNEVPSLKDASGTIASRFIALSFSKDFYGREDVDLFDKLAAEAPGILNWAITGYARLRERRRFVQPDSGREKIEAIERLAAPVAVFVRERCVVHGDKSVPVDLLYAEYRTWIERAGSSPRRKEEFGRDLLAAFPAITKHRPRGKEGSERVQTYYGIDLDPMQTEQEDWRARS